MGYPAFTLATFEMLLARQSSLTLGPLPVTQVQHFLCCTCIQHGYSLRLFIVLLFTSVKCTHLTLVALSLYL